MCKKNALPKWEVVLTKDYALPCRDELEAKNSLRHQKDKWPSAYIRRVVCDNEGNFVRYEDQKQEAPKAKPIEVVITRGKSVFCETEEEAKIRLAIARAKYANPRIRKPKEEKAPKAKKEAKPKVAKATKAKAQKAPKQPKVAKPRKAKMPMGFVMKPEGLYHDRRKLNLNKREDRILFSQYWAEIYAKNEAILASL